VPGFDFSARSFDAWRPFPVIGETSMDTTPLAARHCQPRKGKEHALDAGAIEGLLPQLPGWQ
jgi:hypothetical protein